MIDSNDEAMMTGPRDREITLGTTTILGIFFALAMLCSAFFGFGYSLGSKRNAATAPVTEPSSGGASTAIFNAFKPAAGSKTGGSTVGGSAGNREPAPHETVTVQVNADPRISTTKSSSAKSRADKPMVEAAPVEDLPVPSNSHKAAEASTVPLPAAAAGAVTAVVQIAAVTHQEDADLIASTLKRRGYSVNIRQEPQDKLLHVQVGPFANKKDAEAMRQRLLADGFNAYVK